jgi:ABC-type nitrate/sulfonate/bicarbonate transport system substrate-binding protein
MKKSRLLIASVLVLAACGTADTPATPAPGGSGGALTSVKLQLQWFYQAQFAGYIAAVDQGFYKEQGLDVQLLEGGVDIVPQTVLAQGKADYAVAWVPKALASREQGAGITDVGQIFARSGTYQVAWKSSNIKTAADLKGKKVSVSTAGSLTYWLVSETSRRQGWGPTGIQIQPMGAMPGQIAALKRGDIDGVIMDIGNAFDLEKKGEARILVRFTDIKDFHIHVIFATDKAIAGKPQVVRNFLKGWFETIAFMRSHKAETVKVAKEVMEKDEDVSGRVYDELMPMFSDTGRFDKAALATLSKSYVELKLLPSEPDMSKLYTEAFLPK